MTGGAEGKRRQARILYALSALSLAFFFLAKTVARRPPAFRQEMLRAAELMKEATLAVGHCRESKGVPMDPAFDPNGTGFIGLKDSPLTTSLGHLEAKRTTTNPDFAGLLVALMHQAGIRKGDSVAIGASSSFPALITAALCACQVLELRPLLICSLGASEWGANQPDFTWLEIQDCLRNQGVLDVIPIAVSLGGEGDIGLDMDAEGRAWLAQKAAATGLPFLFEPDLESNVKKRIRLYQAAACGDPIKIFINIGGGYANMGTDSEILKVRPGLAVFREIPPDGRRGVIFEMAARGVPVIHLLYIKGLCDQFGLPWDPRPLPPPGSGGVFRVRSFSLLPLSVISGIYFLLWVLGFLFLREKPLPSSEKGRHFTSQG